MRKGRLIALLVAVALVMLISGCAASANSAANTGTQIAGFWKGLWHGVILPVTFVISLFNHNVGIYEIHNNGGWYNFGFVLGILTIGGGGHAGSRRR